MDDFLLSLTLCLIPMFVAVDPVGLVPVFVSVTGSMTATQRRRVVLQAVPTALAIGVAFIILGRSVLQFLGVGLADLQIAGGALLFIYAMMDLIVPGKPMVREEYSVGIVPLATPLIVGPAVLTLGLVLVDQYGHLATIAALVINLALLMGLLLLCEQVIRLVPLNALRAISKVVDLLLAAIGVALVRQGLLWMLRGQ